MGSIIQSNQRYSIGETPVFVAYIYKTTVNALVQREDIISITMTHSRRRDGIRNNMIVTDVWFPVEFPEGILEDIDISPTVVYNIPIPIASTDLFAKTQNPTFTTLRNQSGTIEVDQYNFIYIPLNGRRFYPEYGQYRTTFKMELENGRIETITFLSEVPLETSTMTINEYGEQEYIADNVIGVQRFVARVPMDNNGYIYDEHIEYGNDIHFKGEVYAKYRDDDGHLVFLNPNDGIGNTYPIRNSDMVEVGLDRINDVYLTVFNTITLQRYIDRIPIGVATLLTKTEEPGQIFADSLVEPFAYNFNYIFPTTNLPTEGRYRFRFEIETKGEISEITQEIEYSLPCIFDIDVNII